MKFPLRDRLTKPLLKRQDAGLTRKLRVFSTNEEMLNLANNDYLSLSNHPQVIDAAKRAIEFYGCSSSASPLITGFGPSHHELLEVLKDWHGFKGGMIWNSGYVANQALLSSLPCKGDLVLADRLIHKSMISGILSSGARLMRYRHCDIDHLEELLEKHATGDRIVFVVTESVFSMDGDYPDLKKMAELKERLGFFWVVDEAHALGWYGKRGSGLVERLGAADSVDVLVGTLGKALGSMGAYSLFRDEVVERYLTNFADEFIYSTYLAPAAASAATAAIECIRNMEFNRESLSLLSASFRKQLIEKGFSVSLGDSPIVSIALGETDAAIQAAETLEELGILVGAVRPPTVPDGTSRLRVSLKADLSEADLARVADTLFDVVRT
ncbi:MAG: 8-amino-7-oxononanoate synthase [Opitutales bacterium]|nr:8-amino-7-oxononanoate synthase [Opitutales bacterium]